MSVGGFKLRPNLTAAVRPTTQDELNSLAYEYTALNHNADSAQVALDRALEDTFLPLYRSQSSQDLSPDEVTLPNVPYQADRQHYGTDHKRRYQHYVEGLVDPSSAPSFDSILERGRELSKQAEQDYFHGLYYNPNDSEGGWGTFGATLTDPLIATEIAAGVITGGATATASFLRTVGIEGALSASIEASRQSSVIDYQQELGNEYGVKEAAGSVALAGAFGGAAGVLSYGLNTGARRAHRDANLPQDFVPEPPKVDPLVPQRNPLSSAVSDAVHKAAGRENADWAVDTVLRGTDSPIPFKRLEAADELVPPNISVSAKIVEGDEAALAAELMLRHGDELNATAKLDTGAPPAKPPTKKAAKTFEQNAKALLRQQDQLADVEKQIVDAEARVLKAEKAQDGLTSAVDTLSAEYRALRAKVKSTPTPTNSRQRNALEKKKNKMFAIKKKLKSAQSKLRTNTVVIERGVSKKLTNVRDHLKEVLGDVEARKATLRGEQGELKKTYAKAVDGEMTAAAKEARAMLDELSAGKIPEQLRSKADKLVETAKTAAGIQTRLNEVGKALDEMGAQTPTTGAPLKASADAVEVPESAISDEYIAGLEAELKRVAPENEYFDELAEIESVQKNWGVCNVGN